jgi:uncharacterized membrane protein YdjX (TVP38/TMEM64 family)
MAKSKHSKIIKELEIVTVIVFLIIIGIFLYSLTNMISLDEKLKAEIYYYGIWGTFLSSAVLDLIPQFLSPFMVLATVIVAGLNVHTAVLLVVLGSTIGSLIGFALGKKYMFRVVNYFVKPETVDRMTNLMNHYGKLAVPISAVTPLPYVPMVFGALNFSKRNFIIYGLLPRVIGLTIFGYLIALI